MELFMQTSSTCAEESLTETGSMDRAAGTESQWAFPNITGDEGAATLLYKAKGRKKI